MKILITGGSGFIGSNLADKLLEEGNKLVIIDKFYKKENAQNLFKNHSCNTYCFDICDKETVENVFEVEKPEVVIHLAAMDGVRNSFEKPYEYVKTNIEGTINILEAARKGEVKKIIFSSSSSVYGNCKAKKFSEEIKDLHPISPYASTKLCGEQLIESYYDIFGISAVCLRFFTVYGPRQRKDLAIRKFTEALRKGESIEMYGDGTTERDYTYIDDVIDAIVPAIYYNKTSYEVINVGGGNPISLKEMISCIEEAVGKRAIINQFPMQKGDVIRTAADLSKAQKLLNYEPKVSFKEGIKKFVEWLNF